MTSNTEQQNVAINNDHGPTVVSAGAGAGKTSVLTKRVERYVREGFQPCQIAAISFTRESASEIERRARRALNTKKNNEIWVSTFHRFGIKQVLEPNWHDTFFDKLNISRQPFKLLFSKYKQANFIRQAINQYLSEEQRRDVEGIVGENNTLKSFESWVGLVRAYGHTPRSYFRQFTTPFSSLGDLNAVSNRIRVGSEGEMIPTNRSGVDKKMVLFHYFIKIWLGYEAQLKEHGLIDNDMVLVLTMLYLENNKDARLRLRAKFPVFLVDEFQDLNVCQFRTTLALVGGATHFSSFGDLKQAIYNFRGGNCILMSKIMELFPNAKQIHLPHNFRSTNRIVAAANKLSDRMDQAFGTEPMIAVRESEQLPAVISFGSAAMEATWIADKILSLKADGIAPEDIGVLYRNKSHVKYLENELLNRRIDFEHLANETGLYDEDEVRQLVTFLHLICVPYSPKLIPSLFSVFPAIRWQPDSLQSVLSNIPVDEKSKAVNAHSLLTELTPKNCPPQVYVMATEVKSMLMPIWQRIDSLRTFEAFRSTMPAQAQSASEAEQNNLWRDDQKKLLDSILKLFLKNFWPTVRPKNMPKHAISSTTTTYEMFFKDIFAGLISSELPLDEYIASRPITTKSYGGNKAKDPEAVKLLTCHGAKGLEKKVIFVIGCTNEQWDREASESEDYISSLHNADSDAENHRLAYVAITRAIDQFWVTHPRTKEQGRGTISTNLLNYMRWFDDTTHYFYAKGLQLVKVNDVDSLMAFRG